MTEDAPSKDFFISYTGDDREWAEWIAWELEEAGYHVIIQAWDFRPGGNWALDMHRGLQKADRLILVLSPNSLESGFVEAEWATFFADDPTGEERKLFPIRIEECEPPGLLKSRSYLDLVGLTDEEEIRVALLDGLKPRGKPDTKPPCPITATRAMPERPEFPVGARTVHNIPHGRNRNFTGRGKLLDDLRKKLTSGKLAALTQAMHGLGGIGKTQAALEYAYRHMSDYTIIWWVRCEKPSTLISDYASLAGRIGLPEADAADEPAIAQAVRAFLSDSTGWLIVFDNVNMPEDIVPYLPLEEAGHVIVTSRNPNWRGEAEPLPVTRMKRTESIDLLLKRSGQTDRKGADALAEALCDFPLALAQAAAYMEEANKTPAEYLDLYRRSEKELLARGKPADDYEATVATTWEISFKAVEGESPAGAQLLDLCAFFAPDDIPLGAITAGAKFLPEPLAEAVKDPLALDDAVAALRKYSLVESADGMLSVHRLVQAVTRARLDGDDHNKWAEAAVQVVNDAFPQHSDDVRTWEECARLLPHALASAGHAEDLGIAPDATARVLNQAGIYLRGRAQFAEAKVAHERALAAHGVFYGEDHIEVAAIISNLGGVLKALGDLPGAKGHYERALRIGEEALGKDHPQVAIYANNLGDVLRALGDLPGAKGHFERALRIGEATLGPDHPQAAIYASTLGLVLQDLGDLPGAKERFERALRISEATLGPDHPTVAIRLNNLGSVLQDLGDLPGAKEHIERALRIDVAAYGPDHPNVAIRLNNLGSVMRDLGDLPGAKEHISRALAILRKFLGDEHPNTKTVQAWLDIVLREIEEQE